jgi:aminoglycoside phosphotransferase family enzyme/predicted kinase
MIGAVRVHASVMTEPAPDLVRDLLRPQAYGAPSSARVSLRTTHASWVFLIGGEVWKVKRPVDFGFLDFRRPEDRRHFCAEEVRLNRRLAPGVYLGIEPVRLAHGHSIGGTGPIVDWAVHMRRLPDEASAASLLGRGVLDAEKLAALAARLAAFVAEVPAVPVAGGADILRRNVEENFAQVEPFVGDVIDAATFEEVRAFQFGALANHADRFAARVDEGRIREGHGDLRLEHVYFLPPPDGIVAIDCIEFNDRFRNGDAAGEAAFLAMELEAARRPDLAAAFLARFAEASDDFGLYGVVDFYLSYRAWVRGKIAAFLSTDPAADAPLRARKREEAHRDFALARSFSGVPVDIPFVIAVGGMIGSGKSTLAKALGRQLAAPVVSSDRTRKALAGLGPTDRGGESLYTPEAVERTYREVMRRAGQVLASGRGVILDATFQARRWRRAAAELAAGAGARFVHVETRCADADVLRARLTERRTQPSVSDATDAELEKIASSYEPVEPDEPGPRAAVDTAGEPELALASALDQLGRAGVRPADARRLA